MNSYQHLFDVSTTDTLYYDALLHGKEKKYEGKVLRYEIVEMSPDHYLEKCTELNHCSLEKVMSMVMEESVVELLKLSKERKLPMPYLDYACQGQEGRHRAVLAKRLGLPFMPVMVIRS